MGSSRESLGEGEESFVGGSLTDPPVVYTLVLWDSGTYVCASLVDVCIQKKREEEEEKTLSFLERDGSSDRSLLHTHSKERKKVH
jgi:hypothetical protein